jgi:hypothetical protein
MRALTHNRKENPGAMQLAAGVGMLSLVGFHVLHHLPDALQAIC